MCTLRRSTNMQGCACLKAPKEAHVVSNLERLRRHLLALVHSYCKALLLLRLCSGSIKALLRYCTLSRAGALGHAATSATPPSLSPTPSYYASYKLNHPRGFWFEGLIQLPPWAWVVLSLLWLVLSRNSFLRYRICKEIKNQNPKGTRFQKPAVCIHTNTQTHTHTHMYAYI